jgi:GGDEF domain-containing protein
MGLFDDIFLPSAPRRQSSSLFGDIFGAYRQPEQFGPQSPLQERLDELARAREAGDRQWAGISAGLSDSPDSTLGAVGQAFGGTAADIGRGVVGFGTGLQEGIGGLEQAAGEQLGWDALAQRGQSIGVAARRTNDLIAPEHQREDSLARTLAVGTVSNAPQMGLVALTGGAALPVLAAQAGGQEYSQARSAGASPEGAGTAALGVGAFEALTEQFGDVRLVKKMLGQVAKAKTVEEGIGKFLGDVAINSGEEGAADIGDRLARWIGYSDKQFGPGWWKGTLNSMAQGAVMPVGAHLSTAESGLPWKSELETSQMNNAFAEGIAGPKPGLFTDIFHDPSLAAPAPAQEPISPPVAPSPVPAMQATQDARMQFLQVPESARIAAQMGETVRAQDERANLAADTLGARTPEQVALGMGMKADYMDFLGARDRRPAPPVPPKESSDLADLNAGIEVQPAPWKSSKKMSKEELRQAYLTSKTGIGNENAFLERQATQPHRMVVAVDMNDFGEQNKLHGHAVGDALLNLQARAFQEGGFDGAYHIHGDEFLLGHDGREKDVGAKLDKARAYAAANPLIVEKDGQKIAVTVSFGHGIGHDRLSADLALTESKARAKAERRARERAGTPVNDSGAVPQAAGLAGVQGRQEGAFGVIEPQKAVSADAVAWAIGTPTARGPVKAKSEFAPIPEGRKPTEWKAAKSGDEPYWWTNVPGAGTVHEASDGSFLLLGEPDKGKRRANGFGEPTTKETEGPEGISVERTIEAHRAHFKEQAASGWMRPVKPIGISGDGHKALIGLDNGGALTARVWDYLQRKAPAGAEFVSRRGMPQVYIVKDGEVVGWANLTPIDPNAKQLDPPDIQNPDAQLFKREPGDDPPDPEDPYGRTPASVEDNSDLPEALRIVGPRAMPDMDPTKLKTWLRKWFTSKGNVSKEFRGVGEKREGAMAAGTIQHKEIAYALQHHQQAYLKAHPNVNQTAFIEAIRDVIHGTPKIGSVPLPAKIQNLAERARALVDSYSAAHVSQLQKMDPDSELAKVIEGNLGTYLNRAYQAFDDPHHLERVKESGLWDHYKAQIAALPEMQGKSDEEVEGLMNHLADRKEDSFGSHGHGMGTLEMGIYKARKEIPTVIRQLMGEYTDPAVEFFQTAEKLNRNVATTEMYLALDELGTKEGWLTKDKAPVGELYKQIGGKAERSPIGGKFTNKEMHEIIVGAHENAQRGILNWLTGIIKTNKTVGSVQAQTRNFESQSLLLSAAGNLGARFTPWGWKTPAAIGLKTAAQQSRLRAGLHADRAGSLANMSNEELAGSWGRGAKLGVNGGGTPDLADIRHFLRESDKLVDPSNPIEKTWSALKSAYKAGDDIPRHAAWQSETAKILWHSPGTSLADAEAQAADLVRDQNPTDGRQMRALKVLRKTPMVGGFISFVSEIPRNGKNIAVQGLREIRDGHKEGNKRKMIVGAHRLGSLVATLAAPELMAAAIMALRHGDDDEAKDAENKAVLRFAPPWMKNSTLNVLHVKDGKAFVVDVSFMDPWATIKKPIMAAIRTGKAAGKDSGDVALSVLRQIGEPYAQEGLGLTTVMDMARNTDRYGGQITSPNAPLGKRISDYASYLVKAVEPGTVTWTRRAKKAVTGEVEKSGRGYSLLGEVAALFGPRFMEIDARQGLKYAGLDYLKGQQDASRELNGITRREGRITPEEIADAQATADKAYEVGAYALIDAVEAARTLGLSKGDIIKALTGKEGAGLSRDDVGAALVGIDELDRRRLSKAKTRAEHDRLLARKR